MLLTLCPLSGCRLRYGLCHFRLAFVYCSLFLSHTEALLSVTLQIWCFEVLKCHTWTVRAEDAFLFPAMRRYTRDARVASTIVRKITVPYEAVMRLVLGPLLAILRCTLGPICIRAMTWWSPSCDLSEEALARLGLRRLLFGREGF